MDKRFLGILVLTILLSGAAFAIGCTAEAKQCPDGSHVGRDANNNCEFTPCPTPSPECTTDKQCPLIGTSPDGYRECYNGTLCKVGGGYSCKEGKCVLTKVFADCQKCPNGCENNACKTVECAKEGEQYSEVFTTEYPSKCCAGLTGFMTGLDTRISIQDNCYQTGSASGWPVGHCTNCGNKICESIETVCSCPGDCIGQGRSQYKTIKEFCESPYTRYCSVDGAVSSSDSPQLCALCSTPNPDCNYRYWFDNSSTSCGYKQFCGAYMYYGLQTFETKEECVKALSPVGCTAEAKICSDGSAVGRNPALNCEFDPCPGESCTEEAKICPDGSYVARDPNNKCEFTPCPIETPTTKEQVKCVFNNSTIPQKCYTATQPFSCSGTETCVAEVYGAKGKTLTWKSTCGGYAYTTIDGTNKYAEFKCEDCKYSYWFDKASAACGYKQFCGMYIYLGLQTFENYADCLKALGSGGQAIEQPSVMVSTGGSGGGSVYSVGVCKVYSDTTQSALCTAEYKPVCATIEQFNTDGTYSKYKKTFSNACSACAASTKTDLVVGYASGECDQDTGAECPQIATPSPEFCPNGKIAPKYGEINGKKCILGYGCISTSTDPEDETPVFIYSSYGGFAYMEKTLYVYKSGALAEKKTIGGQTTKMTGQAGSETVSAFLKDLDAKGFFELKIPEPSCCIILESGIMQCGADMTTQKVFARYGEKQNSVGWCLLKETPESIQYALDMVAKLESLLSENPDNSTKYVSLGEPFDLSLGENAKVKENSFTVKLESIESDAVMVSAWAQGLGTASTWVKIKAGESGTAFGLKITVNSILFPQCKTTTDGTKNMTQCIGGKPYANLTISNAEPDETFIAYLGEKFAMAQGKTFKIFSLDKKDLMKIRLEGISRAVDCPVQKCYGDETGTTKCGNIICDMRAMAKLLISFPPSESEYASQAMQTLAIREGETQNIGEYKIYFAGLSGERAVFVVNKIEDDIKYIKVALGEEFKLQENKTALIVDKDIFVTLIQTAPGAVYMADIPKQDEPSAGIAPYPQKGYAIVSVWKKGWGVVPVPLTAETKEKLLTIQENMKNAGVESNIQEINKVSAGSSDAVFYKKTYTLREGESLKIYDIKLSLKALGNGTAGFVAEEAQFDDTINVHVGEPFKLKENMKARVLEANMLIDLLGLSEEDTVCNESGACTSKPTVKIGVSDLKSLFEGEIGTSISSQQISENAKSTIIESPASSTASGGQESPAMPVPLVIAISDSTSGDSIPSVQPVPPIEIPMPFRIYKLQEGQSATVGDFEITAKAIWANYAEFIVTEKGTGIEFKISIAKGWNLFSIPGEIKTSELSNCSLGDFRLFEFKDGKFEKAGKAEAGKAYWLYNPKEACTIKAVLIKPVSLFELKPLQAGWNFVPVLKDMLGAQIGKMGDCKLKGAFIYDTTGKQWVKALETTLATGHFGTALAVYAEDKCILASPDTPIPEIPEMPALPEVG
ncbi:MAG: hypothetical protein V1493_03110 [Candidatus Diapherotrites archaeon]